MMLFQKKTPPKDERAKIEIFNFNLEKAYKRTGIIANIIIIFQLSSIIIALISYYNTNEFNKRQIKTIESNEQIKNAIEGINKIYETGFLNNFEKLNSESTIDDDEVRRAYYHVLSTYYFLSVVYNSKIADTIMIYQAVKDGIKVFSEYDIYKDSSQVNLNSTKEEINKMIQSFEKINLKK